MVWQRRSIPGVRVFTVMIIASCFWTFTRLLEAGVDEAWAKIFWGKTEYFGILVVSPTWFIFTCYYTHHQKSFRRLYTILLAIIPLITLFLVWTNESHHLIWTTIVRSTTNPEILNYDHGAWFWVAVIYNYALLSSGIWNLLVALRSVGGKQKKQTQFLLLGSFAPIAGNIVYLLGLSPIKGMDLTPFCLTITAGIYFLTVIRFQLFDIRHVARAAIIENMRDGMLIIDEKNHVVDVNPSALQLLDMDQSLITQDIRLTLAKYPAVIAVIMSPHPQPVTLAVGDNPSRYLDVQVSEMNDALGQSAGKLVLVRDVTERRITEKIAFEMAIEQHRMDLLSQFIRDVSHEFKTPLSVINNSLYLMEKSSNVQQQQKRREIIQLQTQRLDYLISEMLTTVQLDADAPFNRDTIDLNTLLPIVIQALTPTFAAKRHHLILHTTEKPLQILGDSLMLQKALTNILQNANRYTPNAGTITVTSAIQDDFATVTISDTGVGMNNESKNRIFERFFRADDAHSTPGFGLGLPIAQSIIEKHQGWVEVESALGAGTSFTIYLPLMVRQHVPIPSLQLAT